MERPTIEEAGQARRQAERCAEFLSLPLQDRNWEGVSGGLTGTHSGSSLDFHDHRVYQPGDDPRHINWQAFARTGSYSLKVFREEVRPIIDLVLDGTRSMFHGDEKRRRSLELFYFVLASANRCGASVRAHLVDEDRAQMLDPQTLTDHRWLDGLSDKSPGETGVVPRIDRVRPRAGSLRVWISDLLFPSPPQDLLDGLVQQNGRGVLLAPYAPEEADPAWMGDCRFVEVENGTERAIRVDRERLEAYRRSYRNHFDLWKTAARRRQLALAQIDSTGSLEDTLLRDAVATGALAIA